MCSLRTVCHEIGCDESGRDKAALLQESFDQFKQHIQGVVPEGIENAMAALALSEAGFEIAASGALSKREEDHMPFDIKKHLGLPATATDADVQKAMEAREAEGALGRNIAKMSSEHVAYMNHPAAHLPTGGKEAFAAMAVEKRDEIIKEYPAMSEEDKKKAKDKADAEKAADAKKRAEGDEVLKVGGTEIRKSVVGDGPFAVMKAQQESILKLEDDRAAAEFTKRAEPLVHIGKADEIGRMLHKISKSDPKLSEQVEAILKVADERIKKGGLFTEVGKGGNGDFSKGGDQIEVLAKELLAKGQAKSIHKAKDMVRQSHPELAKQEQEDHKAKFKAA